MLGIVGIVVDTRKRFAIAGTAVAGLAITAFFVMRLAVALLSMR